MNNNNINEDYKSIGSGESIIDQIMPGGIDGLKQGLDGVAPDLSQYILNFVFGTIYDRQGLALQTKQLLTITILAALGNARPQLEFHIKGALNLGVSQEVIINAFLHIIPYAGFPAAINAISIAKGVFEKPENVKFSIDRGLVEI